MADAYLGLGSNLGDRAAILRLAVEQLSQLGRAHTSSWYETEPVGIPGAPWFLNGACRLVTRAEPTVLMARLIGIEADLGRDVGRRQGSRTIDIDMLFYDDLVLSGPELVLPHPRLQDRAFVLVPLAEIAPQLRHPVLGKTVVELLAGVRTECVRRWSHA